MKSYENKVPPKKDKKRRFLTKGMIFSITLKRRLFLAHGFQNLDIDLNLIADSIYFSITEPLDLAGVEDVGHGDGMEFKTSCG